MPLPHRPLATAPSLTASPKRPVAHPLVAPKTQGGVQDQPLDALGVTVRLEEAGRVLLSLPNSGPSTAMRLNAATLVRMALLSGAEQIPGESARATLGANALGLDRSPAMLRPPMPSAAQITRMDEALAWIGLIPQDRYVLRRVVGCRALIHPLTDRHVYPWRRLAALIGADHKAVQRWHAQAIDLILSGLNRRNDDGTIPLAGPRSSIPRCG